MSCLNFLKQTSNILIYQGGEWNAIRSLVDDRNIIIKKADKGMCIVIWGRNDYLLEAEKQLSDTKVYQEVSNNENILSNFAEMSNNMFSGLKKVYSTEKLFNSFSFEYRKAINFSKLYSFYRFIKVYVTS